MFSFESGDESVPCNVESSPVKYVNGGLSSLTNVALFIRKSTETI